MFVPANMVLKRYLACRTFSKCRPNCNESRLYIRTYTYKIEADNQLHNCVCGALSIKMAVLQIYLRNHWGEERLSCNFS